MRQKYFIKRYQLKCWDELRNFVYKWEKDVVLLLKNYPFKEVKAKRLPNLVAVCTIIDK